MAALDVDKVWADMQQEQHDVKRPAPKVCDLAALQRNRQKNKPTAKKQLDSSLHWMRGWSASIKNTTEASSCDARGAGIADREAYSVKQIEPPTTLIDAFEELPTGTPEVFLAFLQRDINCLGEDALGVRLQSMQKLERVLVQQIDRLATDVVDAVTEALLKPLCKRLKDKSEKCREIAVKILRSLVENMSDLSATLPYIFPTLVSRLGCEDLDGVAHLPEVMRPTPEQRPTEIARPVEDSEEVRLQLAHFVAALLARCSASQVYTYIDEATGLLRAEAMDPFHEVKAVACDTFISFCYSHSEMLLHFAEPMGRSLTSCFTHNHAKIRISALKALTAILWCGLWKHNHEIFQVLMAWQDPNKVPIKAFYEPVTSVNYMSTLSFDRHPAVRRFWFETLSYWLLRVPDKVDHEPYIFPYLLTGLCDENEDIALETFWLIERCGELYEKEKEEELRKTKQYGFDYGWTYQGRALVPFPLQGQWAGGQSTEGIIRRTAAHGPDFLGERDLHMHVIRDKLLDGTEDEEVEDEHEGRADLGDAIPLPERDYAWDDLRDLKVYRRLPRPRLGSRCWVRTHTRRYIQATFNDVVDFRDCTALNAGRLLCMSIAYTEEGVTEWLQPMLAALIKFFSGRAWAAGDTQVMRTYSTVCRLLGCFLDPVSYWAQLRSALEDGSPMELDQRVASARILALCLQGSVGTLQSVQPPDPNLGLGRLAPVTPDLIAIMHGSDLLLSPSTESRKALWELLFSFLEPLRPLLNGEQVAQLLFVTLALAAQAPPEATSELAPSSFWAGELDAEEGLVEADQLQRALQSLSTGINEAQTGHAQLSGFSFDSLDDDFEFSPSASSTAPPPAALGKQESADPRVAHKALFEWAFPRVLDRLDDSFQVFRSVLYMSPLAVVTTPRHSDELLRRLNSYVGPTASSPTRCAAQALSMQLVLRCSRFVQQSTDSFAIREARSLMWKVMQLLGKAQIDARDKNMLSYASIMTCLSLWRRFVLCPYVDPRCLFFPPAEERHDTEASRPLEWLTWLFADQELYKRYHKSLEQAEISLSGRDKDGFVIAKSKQLRDEAERRSIASRCLAASTLLLSLRQSLPDRHGPPIPWLDGRVPGSAAQVFHTAASMFRAAEPTMDPPFVRPTPPLLTLYAAEILHLILHLPTTLSTPALPPAFRLLDDAACAIHQLPRSANAEAPCGLNLTIEERETLAANLITSLLDLNLSLPPDPHTKHAPASLDAPGDIGLGWDQPSTSPQTAALPAEVSRLMAQSEECLRWNAALALYVLGVDFSVICHDGFQQCMVKWKRRHEQAKVLITTDLLDRARRTLAVPRLAP